MSFIPSLAIAAALSGAPMAPAATQETAKADAKPTAAEIKAELEAKFTERMLGATLVGRFTVDGMKADAVPREERYEIESVKKRKRPDPNGGDVWIFTARIKYGKWDLKVPLPLHVVWAGDTPVIAEDDFAIPGMGDKFGCRVMFHGDRYVGTWQHANVGGHMFGRIETRKNSDAKAKTSEADK
ncbi:MAG: hypothetical protein AB8G99_18690 [Planctomycetaceae bacterium]